MDKKIIDNMVAEVNAFRKKNGLPPMTEEAQKDFVARATSKVEKKRRR